MTETEYRAAARELAAAKRILAVPDRHTHAELAYAEARAQELAPQVSAYIAAQWSEQFGEAMAAVSRGVMQFMSDLAAMVRPVADWLARFGATLRAADEARLAEARRRRGERLRAARQRARLSTQVRRQKRKRGA